MVHNNPSKTAALLALLLVVLNGPRVEALQVDTMEIEAMGADAAESNAKGLQHEYVLSIANSSQSWVPDSKQSVVATFNSPTNLPGNLSYLQKQYAELNNFKYLIALLEELARWAKRPGWGHLYYDIEQLHENWRNRWKQQTEAELTQRFILSRANLLQQQHQFGRAIEWLKKIAPQQSAYAQSLLMQARIYQITGQYQHADSICQQLLQPAGLTITQLCFFDNPERLANDQSVNTELFRMLQERSELPVEVKRWQHRLLGDMALLKDNYQAAARFYQFQLQDAPLSQWLQWADAAIASDQANRVRERLRSLITDADSIEDSLLLRLVRAEKLLLGSSQWQQPLAHRITLRQLRDDNEHTADLAYYFTFIEPDPPTAVYWAEMNWQRAKETADKRLLNAAKLLGSGP